MSFNKMFFYGWNSQKKQALIHQGQDVPMMEKKQNKQK